jgi:hypothetical protein
MRCCRGSRPTAPAKDAHERRMSRTVITLRGDDQRYWWQRTRGMRTMHQTHVDLTWSEVVTALVVAGIIAWLLLR